MPYKELTETGKKFIKHIVNIAPNNLLLEGNNGLLPFSNETDKNKIWKANLIWTGEENDERNGTPITTNTQFGEYLIMLFELYSFKYNLDTNIIAAQAYQNSKYRCWYYTNSTIISTESGISQLVMNVIYDILYIKKRVTDSEINSITNGMIDPNFKTSWRFVLNEKYTNIDDETLQKANRSILHQNMINNPQIVIKMQCVLMDYISDRNANLASSSLFAYNIDVESISNNYIEIINEFAKKNGDNEANKGIKYVEQIFGYLGDKDNMFVTNLDKSTIGYWFAYSIDLNIKNWSAFNADTKSQYFPTRSTKSISAIDRELRIGYEDAIIKFEIEHPNTYIVDLTSVYRTPAHQKRLYQKGRDAQGNIIGQTDTPLSSKSKHSNYLARAFDYGIYTKSYTYLDVKNIPKYIPLYEEFAKLVINVVPNAVWGGNFKKRDDVHIQLN